MLALANVALATEPCWLHVRQNHAGCMFVGADANSPGRSVAEIAWPCKLGLDVIDPWRDAPQQALAHFGRRNAAVVRISKRGKQAIFDRLPFLKLSHEKSRYAVQWKRKAWPPIKPSAVDVPALPISNWLSFFESDVVAANPCN
jgi:hypothetical protein